MSPRSPTRGTCAAARAPTRAGARRGWRSPRPAGRCSATTSPRRARPSAALTDHHQPPDHATIARLRARHEIAIGERFGQVLALCARAGLVRLGVVAVDGTKIVAAATHHATRSYEQIAREILKEAAALDAAEDELHG